MSRWHWFLFSGLVFPALALATTPERYARVGDFDGTVEVQLSAADDWIPAERNLPLTEGAWIRTGTASRVEIELDDGSVWRLGPESQGGLADYTRHATGQRVTLLALDHGLAYFTGGAPATDSLLLVAPGAQVSVNKPARLRFEAAEDATQLAVLDGVARFSSPAAEIDVARGQTSRVEPARPKRFFLYKQVAPIDLDRWSSSRDKTLASAVSGLHLPQRIGLADLDAAGQWVQTDDLGAVWQPKSNEGWTPYRAGKWVWLDGLGYTWISSENWGWLPYHYGRWTRHGDLGWVWAPASSSAPAAVFKPAEVFWFRGSKFAAWGPLAPGENWDPKNLPAQWAAANVTYAAFQTEARAIDPGGFKDKDIPKEPLKAGTFVAALPSPTFLAARLEAVRPIIPVNTLRVAPIQDDSAETAPAPARIPQPTVVVTQPAPPPPPEQVEVPVPVLAGIFVVTEPPPSPSSRSSRPPKSSQPAPTPKPVTIPPPLIKGPGHPEPRPRDANEAAMSRNVDVDIQTGRWFRALTELDEWTRLYPKSELTQVRAYDYMQTHSALAHPDRVLEYAAALMAGRANLNEQQTLGLLYLTMANAEALPKPSSQQKVLGALAAQSLLESLPRYFAADRRPTAILNDAWDSAHRQLEATARDGVRKLGR